MAQANGFANGHSNTIPLGLYLWTRIQQIGVSTVLGVPGDFNLEILDYIYQVPGLDFLGNSNELNAAYAADGYARVKENVPGVFVTTHGVGEMSAINGVLGALCERVKVIHVVGQTSRPLQQGKLMIHHSIGNHDNGWEVDHQKYNKMSKGARIAEAELWEAESAPAEIDRVIRECIIHSAPVYIFMPLDLCDEQVPRSLLDKPIDLSLPVDNAAQDAAVSAIAEALSSATKPSIFVDALVHRFGAREECRALAAKLQIPTCAANMGKSIIDETENYFAGIYMGQVSEQSVAQTIEGSDCVLVLGAVDADTNSGAFSRKFSGESIHVNSNNVVVKGERFENTFIKPLIAALAERVSGLKISRSDPVQPLPKRDPVDHATETLTQSWMWDHLARFLQPNDVVIAETGTTSFGILYSKIPANIRFVTQTYYGSIGYATAAALGTELALQELHKETGTARGRTILITGDGSLQLTMQEIGTMITADVKPIIVILNNDGYTIERVIHGARQKYNDINKAVYEHMLPFFGHPDPANSYRRVVRKDEWAKVFEDPSFKEPKNLQIIELMLDKFDVPWRLTKIIAARGPKYVKELEDAGFIGEGRVGIGG